MLYFFHCPTHMPTPPSSKRFRFLVFSWGRMLSFMCVCSDALLSDSRFEMKEYKLEVLQGVLDHRNPCNTGIYKNSK